MTWAAVAIGGSAIIGYMGQQDARRAGQDAQNRNLAYQQEMFRLQDPLSASGGRAKYANQLEQLMKGGLGAMAEDPTLKWMQAQGQQAVERQASATGQVQSGAEKMALEKNQIGTANSYFNQQYDRLLNLSGAGGGRTAPMQGMSGGDAYNMSMADTRSTAALFGAGMQGLAGLYGSPGDNNTGYGTGTGGSGYRVGGEQGRQLEDQWGG